MQHLNGTPQSQERSTSIIEAVSREWHPDREAGERLVAHLPVLLFYCLRKTEHKTSLIG